MPDFSIISQDPQVRALVQENHLERAFHDSLFPRQLFRGEATPIQLPGNLGDTFVLTGVGLVRKRQKPLVPGVDPVDDDYQKEQWTAQLQQYGASMNTHMPTSMAAIADLFLRNCQQLGLGAARTMNAIVRNKLYNSALSGHTVADQVANQSGTTLRVKRINGFTRARQAGTTPTVRFDFVSASNPLPILLFDNGAEVSRNVIGFTADNVGDEIGPGTLTLDVAAIAVANRAYVVANDRTFLQRVSGGKKVDTITSNSVFKLSDARAVVANFRTNNVPEHAEGTFHIHLDPTSEGQIYNDAEWQRLLTSMPDGFAYKSFAIGHLLGCIWIRNSECPIPATVDADDGVTQDGTKFSLNDPFAGEMTADGTASGVPVHRPLFTGQSGVMEYYTDMAPMVTEAGVTGKVGSWSITNNGIEVMSDRIRMLLRAPLDKLLQVVTASWTFIGDWPVRTDATTGLAARYKRSAVVEHGE